MNAVSLTIDTWLGIIATVLTMTIAIVTAVAFLHRSAMERIVALEAKIDKLQESIDKLTPYREPQSSNRHQIEERLAQQAADRAAVMARIGRDGSLAVR